MTIWDVLDEESWNKGVGVGYLYRRYNWTSPDTVEVALKGSKSPYLTGKLVIFILFRFSCRPSRLHEMRRRLSGEYNETAMTAGKWTLEGKASVELAAISGKYQGQKTVSLPERTP